MSCGHLSGSSSLSGNSRAPELQAVSSAAQIPGFGSGKKDSSAFFTPKPLPTPHSTIALSSTIPLSSIIPLPSSVTGIPGPTGILNSTSSSNTTGIFNSTNPSNSSSPSNTTSFDSAPAYVPAAPNIALNALDGANYPTGFNISVAGKPIDTISAVFFGGDLCQTGGDYSSTKLRTSHRRSAFGLGNHERFPHPAIGWYKGRWSGDLSSPSIFWRYQMWNPIARMRIGYRQLLLPDSNPVYGIPWQNIDSDTGEGTFSYKDHSLNYVIDMGPFDIFQFHRCGGDSDDDRQSGVGWLEGKLEERGPTRPIIIVQHYLFSQTIDTNGSITPAWTSAQRNALLDTLSPYNIVAFLVGHDHSVGAAFNQNAALVRVTLSNMDVLYGTANNGQLTWTSGQNFTVAFANQIWEEVADWNGNYFGKLGSIYVDARAACTPGQGHHLCRACTHRISAPPRQSAHVTPYHRVANVTGDAGSNNFPHTSGMPKIHVDLSPVACPPRGAVVGVFFLTDEQPRRAGLVVRNTATGVESNVTIRPGTTGSGWSVQRLPACRTQAVSHADK
ncbi:hypothetical protein BC834DRAFT_847899 [Gloeopeniophorella convolvens]|nr:hypothetical protein BC834DRAFT_847899 [Gloeopeniophorella convolvens]